MIKEFAKYFAIFESDPLKKSIGLKPVNPKSWHQFGPTLSSSLGYSEFIEQPTPLTADTPGGNTFITEIGFNFDFGGETYNKFIASPNGWLALLDPASIPTASLDTIYNNRILSSGSNSYDNSLIKSGFVSKDVLLAPWFDRLLMSHKNLDSFVTYYSGTSPSLADKKHDFLFGKIQSGDQPFDEFDYGMKYTTFYDPIEGKSLIVRWTSLGYEYRGKKLSFEAALFQNGKIEFNFAPLANYSTDYTLIQLTADPVNVWKLDESTGATVNDAMNANNLIYKTPANMRPSAGIIDTASFFSGSTNTVIYANDATFANYVVTDSFSFSAWFKGALLDSSTKCILSRMEDNFARGYSFTLAGGSIVLTLNHSFNTETLQVTSVPNSYSDDNWHHAVVTYNGNASASGVKIYIDGQQISTTTTYSTLTVSSNIQGFSPAPDFLIGAIGTESTNDQRFTGSIDDVARWNSVLTSTDVDLLYTQGLKAISAADIEIVGDSTTSYATCGIFASGSSTWNYRDFAPLIGSSLENRLTSSFGGALYTGSYSDIDIESEITASYTVNLGINNWPKHGGRITFSPPQERIKLVRSDINKYESNALVKPGGFDARKSISYNTQENVDASTALPKSYVVNSTYPGIHTKQNLYKDGGITIPNRKVLSNVSNYYLQDDTERLEKSTPFSEMNIFDQDKEDPFFMTGSISSFGGRKNSFSKKLSSKKQVKLNFLVDKKTKLFTSASSLYYFNVATNQWNIPAQSLSDQTENPFSKLAASPTWAPNSSSRGSIYLEDKIGFDSLGNCVASGSLNVFRSAVGYTQSTADIGKPFNINDHMTLVIPSFPKSIQRNPSYDGKNEELFSLPISDPFLLEKAVISLPFCMGDDWFRDRTTFLITSASNYLFEGTQMPPFTWFDEGGPVITVALFCQKQYGQSKVRDLIFKTSFTHVDDLPKSIELYNIYSGSSDLTHVAAVLGNSNNANILSGNYVQYVVEASKKVFTGSVVVKSDVSVTNGAQVGVLKKFKMSDYLSSGSMLQVFEEFLNSTSFSLLSGSSEITYLLGIDALGRSMSGFGAESNGESLTTNGLLAGSNIFNPFYCDSAATRQTITSSLESNFLSLGTGSFVYCAAKVPLCTPTQSPFIIYPEDKLILAVSKTRPAYRSADVRINSSSMINNGKIQSIASSSYFNDLLNTEGHDVYFNTGTISISLYGSNVQFGEEVEQ